MTLPSRVATGGGDVQGMNYKFYAHLRSVHKLVWSANIGERVLPKRRPVHADQHTDKMEQRIEVRRSRSDRVPTSARGCYLKGALCMPINILANKKKEQRRDVRRLRSDCVRTSARGSYLKGVLCIPIKINIKTRSNE